MLLAISAALYYNCIYTVNYLQLRLPRNSPQSSMIISFVRVPEANIKPNLLARAFVVPITACPCAILWNLNVHVASVNSPIPKPSRIGHISGTFQVQIDDSTTTYLTIFYHKFP